MGQQDDFIMQQARPHDFLGRMTPQPATAQTGPALGIALSCFQPKTPRPNTPHPLCLGWTP